MAISKTIRKLTCKGNGSATIFNFPFKILEKADFTLIHTDSSGVSSALTLDTDYSLSGVANDNGVTVTYPLNSEAMLLQSGERLTGYRTTDITQLLDFMYGGGFSPRIHENAFDKITLILQEFSEELERRPMLPITRENIDIENWVETIENQAGSAQANAETALTNSSVALNTANTSLGASSTAVNDSSKALEVANNMKSSVDKSNIAAQEAAQVAKELRLLVAESSHAHANQGILDLVGTLGSFNLSFNGIEQARADLANVDMSPFAKTDGSNLNVPAYRIGLGIDELEGDITGIGELVTTNASNFTELKARVKILEDEPEAVGGLSIAPQTIVKGHLGNVPVHWSESWCDRPASHLTKPSVRGYRDLLPLHFTEKELHKFMKASSEYPNAGNRYCIQEAFLQDAGSETEWASNPKGEVQSITYEGRMNEGTIEAYALTTRIDNTPTDSPRSWVLKDLDGNVLDTRTDVTNWGRGETKVFTLDTPVDTSSISGFTISDLIGQSGYTYICIAHIALLQSSTEGEMLNIASSLQVCAGTDGTTLLSEKLAVDTSISLNAFANGTYYVYADLNEDGSYNSFSCTNVEPQVGTDPVLVRSNPFITDYRQHGFNVEVSSEYTVIPKYQGHKAFNGVIGVPDEGWASDGNTYLNSIGNESIIVYQDDLIPIRCRGIKVHPWSSNGTIVATNNPAEIIIEGCNDKESWKIIKQHEFCTWALGYPQTIDFLHDYSYLRFRFPKTNGAGNIVIDELEILDYPDFYNISNHTHTTSGDIPLRRVYLGECTISGGAIIDIVNYQHGTVVTMPVNGGASVGVNQKHYLNKPFLGYGTSQVRVYFEGKWGKPGFFRNNGTRSHFTEGVLSVRSGLSRLVYKASDSGGEFVGETTAALLVKVTAQRGY